MSGARTLAKPHLAEPVFHQQNQILEFGRARVHEVPPQLGEAGCMLAPTAAAGEEGCVDLRVGFGSGAERPWGQEALS